jgi:predicted kinase
MKRNVVLLAGLPASGKTTTADRVHRSLGGVLIRSCDVYQELGISLPEWVRRTRGFSENVRAYEQERDRAYAEMARQLRLALASDARLVVVDAVHGERSKRAAVYAVCRAHQISPTLVWCRCDDFRETQRRISARRGHEHEPQQEASDLSVYAHIAGLWEDPVLDAEDGLGPVSILLYDTVTGLSRRTTDASLPVLDLLEEALRSTATNRRTAEAGPA